MLFHRLAITALAATAFLPLSASGQDAQAVKGAFRGTMVCEKMPAAPDILRAPFDLKVDDVQSQGQAQAAAQVQYARPIFNWNGTRVLGSEIGNGTLDRDGKIRLAATWSIRGIDYRVEYTGTLTQKGGTLMGTQAWQSGRGASGSRTCSLAVVPAPQG